VTAGFEELKLRLGVAQPLAFGSAKGRLKPWVLRMENASVKHALKILKSVVLV
jgi:hypothetical protein